MHTLEQKGHVNTWNKSRSC